MQRGIDALADDTEDGVRRRDGLRKALELKDYEFNAHGVELGQRYASSAVVGDGTPEPAYDRDPELHYHPTTWPGARLPHCWLGDGGRRVSTHDLAGKGGFTLLTGVTGAAWVEAARKAGAELGIEVRAFVIGPKADYSDLYDDWARLREVAEDGCVLVRPDAHVAWRSAGLTEDPAAALTDALRDGPGPLTTGHVTDHPFHPTHPFHPSRGAPMKLHPRLAVASALTTTLALALSACGGEVGGGSSDGGEGSADGGGSTLTIGYVSPQTGPLAAFGEADSFVVDQMKTYFTDNPIEVDGKQVSVEIVVKDAQSDSTRAGEVAADLINSDGVDLVLASSTPDIVNPVSEQCEANSVPCITTVAPWQTVALRDGADAPADLAYTHHFFWGLEDVAAVYSDMWGQVDTNGRAGGLFPNDPDGEAWSANFPALTEDSGVTIDNPGLYPNGTQDFTAQISALKGTDILMGVPIPPDFTTFWQQANQQGYAPKLATIGKALLFPSVVEGIGETARQPRHRGLVAPDRAPTPAR